MSKDPTKIPKGEYCYSRVAIQNNELTNGSYERFGYEVREVKTKDNDKIVLCPYWVRTEYGTIRCNFLNEEFIDDDLNYKYALDLRVKHFGSLTKAETYKTHPLFTDNIKICKLNLDD